MGSLACSLHLFKKPLFVSWQEGRRGNGRNDISRARVENRKSGQGER